MTMQNNFSYKEAELFYKALANKRRLEIVKMLSGSKKYSVTDIARALKLSVESTSRHLSILYKADLLDKEQKSLLIFYSLRKSYLTKVANSYVAYLAK